MIYILLADGFEEIEALAPCDLLRRAEIDVCLCSVTGSLTLTGRSNITVMAENHIENINYKNLDGIILPGGMAGTVALDESINVDTILKYAIDNKKLVAAICAAPSVLGKRGYLECKKATCNTNFKNQLLGAEYVDEAVVVDDNFITAKGAGCSISFGLECVKYFKGDSEANKIASLIF